MTINWMPEHFNQRRPKTSYLLGQAIGESLGKASDMYLKGKMDNYFQSQKDDREAKIEQAARERSAEGYEKLTGIKGLSEMLKGVPTPYHGKAVQEYGGGGAQRYINDSAPSYQNPQQQPQPPPSPQKTATSVNNDIATAQRMGLSGQKIPGITGIEGIPERTGQGVNGSQQVEGDGGQLQPPGGQARPKMRYPLAEMSNEQFKDVLRQYPGMSNQTKLINSRAAQQAKQQEMMLKEEVNDIAREKLYISKRKEEKELQELHPSVRKEYEEARKSYLEADNTINSLDNIEELLSSGAQMPEMVTSIRKKLGENSGIANFVEGLARNDLASAVDTAKVQMFRGAKEVFGGQMRVSEFNEWIKKLPSVSDPAIANKIKISLIRQFAQSEKFKYKGLKKAIQQDRNAPSDVLLDRSERYTSKMSKSFFDKEKKTMNKLISSSKDNNEQFKVGEKIGVDKFKHLPVGTKIKSKTGILYEKTLNGFREVAE